MRTRTVERRRAILVRLVRRIFERWNTPVSGNGETRRDGRSVSPVRIE
jgi:hypothetical protein